MAQSPGLQSLARLLEQPGSVVGPNEMGRITTREDSEMYGTTMSPNSTPGLVEQLNQILASNTNVAPPGAANPANGTPGADGLAPMTGWAGQQGFAPEQLESIYTNPWYLLQHVFNGIDTASPGYQALRDFGGDPLALFNITQGAGRTVAQGGQGQGDFANFMQNLYQNLGSPGGQALSATELLGNIFNEDVSGDTTSTLGSVLNAGDMNQQVRTLFNMLRDVASTTMNPLAAAGYQSAAARAGDQYGSEMLTRGAGDTPHIIEWMNQNMPGLTVR